MTVRGSVFVATSVDGFIARLDGTIDWLPGGDTPGEDYGYAAFYQTVDVVVMGRRTFEICRSFDPWPYKGKRVVVWTRGSPSVPPALAGAIELSGLPPIDLMEHLAYTGSSHAYVDGGMTIQAFLAHGLIQKLTITRVPVLLGIGTPLFGPLEREVSLQHVVTRSYPNGLVQTSYALDA